jgi:mRNA interferase RelE/StbE|tara:strand:- start:11481 stop:11726 length:246 start_codon:yes stop_codon:yes gene_type:complete
MYKLIYSDRFFKQIKKLNKDIQVRIVSTLERCRIRPHAHVKKLVGPYYGLRVGDYRVILDIKENKLMIFVIEAGHRRNIYK